MSTNFSQDLGNLETLDIKSSSSTDDNVDKEVDLFDSPYHLYAEQATTLDKVYLLDISVKQGDGNVKVATSLSNHNLSIYDLSNHQLNLNSTLKGHTDSITNVMFSPKADNILYSSSLDGSIKIWDLRTNEFVKELKHNKTVRPLTCFDISCNERFACAGSELIDDDTFILFWDIRARKLLGGYWQSHFGDVTQIKFHPTNASSLASSATDGLINVFDISQSDESDALQHSLNTESSVLKLNWFQRNNTYDYLSCVQDTETVQLWDVNGAGPDVEFSREYIGEGIQLKNVDDCYVVNVHQKADGSLFLLAGSTYGNSECLRALSIKNNSAVPLTKFVGNRQIVRTSLYDPDSQLLFTGGESGVLSVWKEGQIVSHRNSTNVKKMKKIKNKHKTKPY